MGCFHNFVGMGRFWGIVVVLCFVFSDLLAQNGLYVSELRAYRPVSVQLPYMASDEDVYGGGYNVYDLLRNSLPSCGDGVWSEIHAGEDSIFSLSVPENGYALYQYGFTIVPSAYVSCSLMLSSTDPIEVFIDGKRVSYKNSREVDLDMCSPLCVEFGAEPRAYNVCIKRLAEADSSYFPAMRLWVEFGDSSIPVCVGVSLLRPLQLSDFTEYNRLSDLSLSPDGKLMYSLFKRSFSDGSVLSTWGICDVGSGERIYGGSGPASFKWIPRSDLLYEFVKLPGGNRAMRVLSPREKRLDIVAEHLPDGEVCFSPTGKEFFILNVPSPISDGGLLKRAGSLGVRSGCVLPAANLFRYSFESGLCERLTFGDVAIQPLSFSSDGRFLLFKTEREDLTRVPYYFSSFYRMDLISLRTDTVLRDVPYVGSGVISPSGDRIVFIGSPNAFDGIGRVSSSGVVSNDYDMQLFLYDIRSCGVSSITGDFAPSVESVYWFRDGELLFTAVTGGGNGLFRYDFSKGRFFSVPLDVSVLNGISFDSDGSHAVYSGEWADFPVRVFSLDLRRGRSRVVEVDSVSRLTGVSMGYSRPFDVVDSLGVVTPGRLYFPPNFDVNKRYPLIVYYYGGVFPTRQGFDSRYPPHLFAAMGYVVYTLDPVGAIGYGQEYSSFPHNDWGKCVTGQIIRAVKFVLSSSPFIDSGRVGCIGASYGGMITQLLLTQTDIFGAAVSHAGISNVASYWGSGTWGYLYGLTAGYGLFPWNNRECFVEQSSLFNADRIHTPLLLLHGGADDNVPLGESRQLYTALKLLGREVELIEVENEGHSITGYAQRYMWYNSIFAWFERFLKGNSAWWDALYLSKP